MKGTHYGGKKSNLYSSLWASCDSLRGIETLSAYLDTEVWDKTSIQDRVKNLSMHALETWGI